VTRPKLLAPPATLPSWLVQSADHGADLETVVEYLGEVARVRQGPLNIPLAFNALAFGFDLSTRRYCSTLIDPESLPCITLGETTPVLPSGALARLSTASEPLSIEVLYREGEHQLLDATGMLPAWLSGAPQGATGPLRSATSTAETADSAADRTPDQPSRGLVVRERLVADVTVLDPAGLGRARRLDRRWLTDEGHVLVHSAYADAEQADLPESRLYATYLLERQSGLLAAVLHHAGLGPERPEEWIDGELEQTLQAVLDSIEVLLTLSPLRQWRESWLHPKTLEDFATGRGGIHADDVRRRAHGLARDALGRDLKGGLRLPDRPAYLALGPALRHEFAGDDAVRGARYASTINCASLTLIELLEAAGGTVDVGGQPVHVRLDDAFQGGGVWRAQVVGPVDTGPPTAGAKAMQENFAPVDLPLALGWAEAAVPAVPVQRVPRPGARPTPAASRVGGDGSSPTPPTSAPASVPDSDTDTGDGFGNTQPTGEPATGGTPPGGSEHAGVPSPGEGDHPEPDALPVQDARDEPTDTRSDDTVRSWTFPLTQRAKDAGVIVLSAAVSDTMHDARLVGAPLQVRIDHPGIDAQLRQQPVSLAERRLIGLTWPDELFVGMRLVATWNLDGGGYFIVVQGIALDEPMTVDGIPLDYAFDEEVLLRSWGTPTDLEEPDDSLSPAAVLNLLRRYALRSYARGGVTLFLPWRALVRQARAFARQRGLHQLADLDEEALTAELERCVDGLRLRSTMHGSVLVEWGIGSWQDGVDGPYRQPLTIAVRGGRPHAELCVTLRLWARPSGRPSLKPKPVTGTGAVLSTRRGHSRILTRGTPSEHKRAELYAWADAHGINRDWLDPRMTFVAESEVRRNRRR
jgi:hypothetical protein